MKSKIKLIFNNVAEIVGNERLGLLALTDEAQTMELLIPCDREMKEQLGLRLNHLPITKMLLPEVGALAHRCRLRNNHRRHH